MVFLGSYAKPFILQTWHVVLLQKVRFLSHLTTLNSPSSSDLSKCCVENFKWASTCLFFNNGAFCGEHALRLWRWNAFPFVSRWKLYLLPSSLSGPLSGPLSEWSLVPGLLFWLTFWLPDQKSCEELLCVVSWWWNDVPFSCGKWPQCCLQEHLGVGKYFCNQYRCYVRQKSCCESLGRALCLYPSCPILAFRGG